MRGRGAYLWIAALALVVLALVPMLQSGFIGDDLPNSYQYTRAAQEVRGTSLAGDISDSITGWWVQGRFNPFANYILVLFHLVEGSVLAYRLVLLTLNLAVVASTAYFGTRVTGSAGVGGLVLLLAPVVLQSRVFEDPILSYAGHPQVAFLLVLWSVLAFLRFLDTRRRGHLAVSLLLYLIGALTYEVVMPLVLLHLVAAWLHGGRRTLRETLILAWPILGLAAVDVAFVLGLRMTQGVAMSNDAAAAYVPNFELATTAITYLKQLVASVPFIYRFTAGKGLLTNVGFADLISPMTLLIAGPVLVIAVLLLQAHLKQDTDAASVPGSRAGVLMALIIVALPGVLTSLSPRYQDAMLWGLGYLPVYISYMGVALLLAIAVWTVLRSVSVGTIRRLAVFAVAGVLALGSVVNFYFNREVADFQNAHWVAPIRLLESAAARGLLAEVPEGAWLYSRYTGVDPRWEPLGLYVLDGDVRVGLTPSPDLEGAEDTQGWQGEPLDVVYYTSRQAASASDGHVLLGRVGDHSEADGAITEVELDSVRIYVARPEWGMQPEEAALSAALEEAGLDPESMELTESGEGWAICDSAAGYRPRLPVR